MHTTRGAIFSSLLGRENIVTEFAVHVILIMPHTCHMCFSAVFLSFSQHDFTSNQAGLRTLVPAGISSAYSCTARETRRMCGLFCNEICVIILQPYRLVHQVVH